MKNPLFPVNWPLAQRGGPQFKTLLVQSPGRAEQRNVVWTRPLGAWEFSARHWTEAQTQTLLAFFRLTRGRAHGFRFKDFSAGESSAVDQLIGAGTGSSEEYQLVKRYTLGGLIYDRIITKPVPGTVKLKVNTVPTTSFTVDTTTGVITINATNGHPITATYEFHVPCRFDNDWCNVRRVDKRVFSWDAVRVVEIRV